MTETGRLAESGPIRKRVNQEAALLDDAGGDGGHGRDRDVGRLARVGGVSKQSRLDGLEHDRQ
jgi:hypothetical protein